MAPIQGCIFRRAHDNHKRKKGRWGFFFRLVGLVPRFSWPWALRWAPLCLVLALAAGFVWWCIIPHLNAFWIIFRVAVDATLDFFSPMHTRMAVARGIVDPSRENVDLLTGYLTRPIASVLSWEAAMLCFLLVSTSPQSGIVIFLFSWVWTDMRMSPMFDPLYVCGDSEWTAGHEDMFALAAVVVTVMYALGTMQARGADVLTQRYAWFFALLFAFTYVAWASCAMASSAVAFKCDVCPVKQQGGFSGSFANRFVWVDYGKLKTYTNGSATATDSVGGDDDSNDKYVQM